MKAIGLKTFLAAGMLAIIAFSCREGDNRNNRYDNDRGVTRDYDRDDNRVRNVAYSEDLKELSGEGTRVWEIRREVSPGGDSDYKTREERDENFAFHSNYTFSSTTDERGHRAGRWSYNGTTLSLNYNDGTSASYTVERLTDNRMRLEAFNGAEVILIESSTAKKNR